MVVPPAVTVVVLAVFVSERSAWGPVPEVNVAELFVGSGSGVAAVTDAVLTRLPVWLEARVALIVTISVASTASCAAVHVTVPAMTVHGPPVELAVTPLRSAGSGSVIPNWVAVEGPLLLTVSV